MAKTIKDIAEKILEENKDEIISVYDRYAGIIDGANAVLEEIENFAETHFADYFEPIKLLRDKIKQLKD